MPEAEKVVYWTTYPLRDGQEISIKHHEPMSELLGVALLEDIKNLSLQHEKEFIKKFNEEGAANAGN